MISKLFSSLIIGCFCTTALISNSPLTRKQITKSHSQNDLKKPAKIAPKKVLKRANSAPVIVKPCSFGFYIPHKFRQDGQNFVMFDNIPLLQLRNFTHLCMLMQDSYISIIEQEFEKKLHDASLKKITLSELVHCTNEVEKIITAVQAKTKIKKIPTKRPKKQKKNLAIVIYGDGDVYMDIECNDLGRDGSREVDAETELWILHTLLQKLRNLQNRYSDSVDTMSQAKVNNPKKELSSKKATNPLKKLFSKKKQKA